MVLLARRGPHRTAYPDLWSFPGGHLDASETLEAALIRELREEIGVTPTEFAPFGTIADPSVTDPATYHMFAVTKFHGEPTLRGDEHTALRWFTPSDAAALSDLALPEYRRLFGMLNRASRDRP
jgi:8-oxo-dGTP diphosphatase